MPLLINNELIRKLRHDHGFSQEDAAHALGMSPRTLGMFENGGYKIVSTEGRISRRQNLELIASFYKLSDWTALTLPMPPAGLQAVGDDETESWQGGTTYLSRHNEQIAIKCLVDGRPVFVLAPHGFGKTSFWHAVRRGFPKGPGDQWLILPLSGLSQSALADVAKFERALVAIIDAQLEGTANPASQSAAFEAPIDTPSGGTAALWSQPVPFEALSQRLCELLRALEGKSGRLLLVIDDLHAVFDAPYSPTFLAFLRARCEDKDAPWDQLRVLFASSLRLIESPNGQSSSPLANVVHEIELKEFTQVEIGELANLYNLDRNAPELVELLKSTGGHPYLVSLVLEHAQHFPLASLVSEILRDPGCSVLTPYLSTLWQWLADQPSMSAALETLDRLPGAPLQVEARRGLWRMGLIRLECPRGFVLRSPLYKSLLNHGGV